MMIDNIFRTSLSEQRFVFSAELVLGRDHSIPEAEDFVREAARDPNGVRVISVTDLPGGNPALPPEFFVSFIREQGLCPLAHLAGKDTNRAFLESRLHGFARAGVENILALTGDAQKDGFLGRPKPVYDMDSVLILSLIEALREGITFQMGTRSVRSTPFDFFPGAVVNPFKVSEAEQMMQLYKAELKVLAGARFIITQLGYNLRKLNETRQYLERLGMHIPVLANVYVPTATVAKMMREGEVAGCVIPDELIRRLEKEKKPERLERAALMVAAAGDLGFAGAHIGGFRLAHSDFMTIIVRSQEIGADWRRRLDELVFPWPGEFYLFPAGSDGLSNGSGDLQLSPEKPDPTLVQELSRAVHACLIEDHSLGARFLRARLGAGPKIPDDVSWRRGFWYRMMGLASLYRKSSLHCDSCGDCIQDHLNYAGCTVGLCYKGLRNGPCGGSRVDGTCEARPDRPCRWNEVYRATLSAGEDPKKFSSCLIPPRDWRLDHTNSLANRFADLDNYSHRQHLSKPKPAIDSGADNGS